MAFGKWLLGGLGFAFGGPLGALVGVALGSIVDGVVHFANGASQSDKQATTSSQSYSYSHRATPGDIRVSLLVLIAYVMKVDGRVLKSEVHFIKPYLIQLYGEEGAKQALQLLKQLLDKEIDYVAVCRQIKQYVNYSSRLEMVHMLLDLANADGEFSISEQSAIQRIADLLELTKSDYHSLEAIYHKVTDPNWAFSALEITPSASDEEVKKAYRRMAMKYHPDKVANDGEEIHQKAVEKFRAIHEAYEHIKVLRKMK